MAILITSPGLVTTGTEGADDIRLNGGLTGNGSVVEALAGNDTITINGDGGLVAAASSQIVGPIVKGQGGADVITLSGVAAVGSAANAEVYGNAGGDTISLDGVFGVVNGGNGNDVVTLSGGTYSAVSLGAGADRLELSASTFATGGSIMAGAGSDVISGGAAATLNQGATIKAGGGADTITLDSFGGITGDLINAGAGNDSVTVASQATLSKINGADGSDTITVGSFATGSTIAGAAGADVITVSGFGSGSSVLGGAGTDSLTVTGPISTGEIIGGGGNDTILIGSGATFANLTVQGGAGVDSITFSGAVSGSDLGTLEFGSFTDSTVSAFDTVDFDNAVATTTGEISIDIGVASSLVLGSAGASLSTLGDLAGGVSGSFTSGVGVTGTVVDGYMALDASAGLTTAAGFADKATLIATSGNKGSSVIFTTQGMDFLFIQGGAAGTQDDALFAFNGATGGLTTMTGTTITFNAES